MADEPNRESAEDYKQAAADAKAAAARAKALRPWYRKKRYILGIPLLVIVGLIVLGALTAEQTTDGTDAVGGPTSAAQTAAPSSEQPPGIGDLVKVGSLDLMVYAVERDVDTTQYNMFNEANSRVQFRAVNARGDANSTYSIAQFSFRLVDEQGVAHDAEVCIDCPGAIGMDTNLIRGGASTWWVYFKLPQGREAVTLLYEPLFSTNKARIDLR